MHGSKSGFTLKGEKKNTEHRALLGLELFSLVIKRDRFRWFGYAEHKHDADWVKRYLSMETRETRYRGCQRRHDRIVSDGIQSLACPTRTLRIKIRDQWRENQGETG